MRKLIFILSIALSLSCKAQTIIPMYGGIEFEHNSNYYLKDTDNVLNNYEGIWKWQNGNSSFTLVLKKFEQVQRSSGLYKDYLLGEYQYVDNGNELVNTLSSIDDTSITLYRHMLWSQSVIDKNRRPQCNICGVNERRVRLTIRHPTVDDVYADLVLRYVIVNGVEQLEANLFGGGPGVYLEGRTDPLDLDVPYGDYVLIKQ
jgi:hypothetical protein